MRKKVILLGGTFDPIHNTHLQIAREASQALDAPVWFVIAKKPRWKENYTPSRLRLKMLEKALEGEENMEVCPIELTMKSRGISYTIDTVLALIDQYKNYQFYYLIGSDQLDKLDQWRDIDMLSKLVKFVLVKRPGYPINELNMKKYKVKDVNLVGTNISSTSIRNHLSTDYPEQIKSIIMQEGLYIKEYLKNSLSEPRYKHSLRVAKLARKLASSNKVDTKKAYIAGLIHDCAKELSREEAYQMMQQYEPKHINERPQLYHQYLAPIIAKKSFGIEDEEILYAIKYHATANKKMPPLAKIIYCADKTEESRPYDSSFLVERCFEDINVGFAFVINDNVEYLLKHEKNAFINEDTLLLNKQAKAVIDEYLLKIIIKTLDDGFANNINIIDISEFNPLAKYYVVCDAASDRQLQALASNLEDTIIQYHYKLHHVEGRHDKNWVLVDAFDVVVHLFKSASREDYKLEKLWSEAPQFNAEEVLKWKTICG